MYYNYMYSTCRPIDLYIAHVQAHTRTHMRTWIHMHEHMYAVFSSIHAHLSGVLCMLKVQTNVGLCVSNMIHNAVQLDYRYTKLCQVCGE